MNTVPRREEMKSGDEEADGVSGLRPEETFWNHVLYFRMEYISQIPCLALASRNFGTIETTILYSGAI